MNHRSIGLSTLYDVVVPNIEQIGAEYDPLYCVDPLLPVSIGNIGLIMDFFRPHYACLNIVDEQLDPEEKSYLVKINDEIESDPFKYTTGLSGLIIYRNEGIKNERYYGLSQIDGNNYLAKRVVALLIIEWSGIEHTENSLIPQKLIDYYARNILES